MKIQTSALLSQLNKKVNSHIEEAKMFLTLPEEKLQFKLNNKSWSIVECVEHLNLYAIFYNREIAKCLKTSTHNTSTIFKSGFLGDKFANDMLPKEGMKKMNTFKSKNPIHSKLNAQKVLTNFITHQETLLDILALAKDNNLTKIKTATTLPLLKLRLGDTLRFVINHNERHIVQAKNVLQHIN